MAETHSPLTISRYDFGGLRDFGEPFRPKPVIPEPIVEEAPPPPPPPTFSEAEREAARAEGFAAGKREGFEEGKSAATTGDMQQTELLQQSFAALVQSTGELQNQFGSTLESYRLQTIELAIAVARQVCSATLAEAPGAMLSTLVERSLPVLIRQPKITATVHPDLELAARRTLIDITGEAGYDGILEVKTSPNLAPHDARLAWADGSAEISQGELWKQIEQLLLAPVHHAPRAAPAALAHQSPSETNPTTGE